MDTQCILSTSDKQGVFFDFEQSSCGGRDTCFDREGCIELPRFAVGIEAAGARGRVKGADPVAYFVGGFVKVDPQIVFFDHGCVGGAVMILWRDGEGALDQRFEGFCEGLGADSGQSIMQRTTRIFGEDGRGVPFEHRACVHAFVEEHGGDACLGFSASDGPLNGCRTSIIGKQRSMAVDATKRGDCEGFGAEDLAVSYDHCEVWGIRTKTLIGLFGGHLFRLKDGESCLLSEDFDGGRRDLFAASLGAIGLCIDSDDFVWTVEERL